MASSTIRNLAASIRARVASSGGAEIDLTDREPMREPPRFSKLHNAA
jgi:hypothetical protein